MTRRASKAIANASVRAASRSVVESPRSKRKQIVKAATEIFLSHGYEGTSVADVAAAAGVIKATIYSHFEDKTALFKAIIEDLTLQESFVRIESSVDALTPSEFIDFWAGRICSRNKDSQFRALVRVVVGESGRFPELARLFYETVSARGNRLVARYIAARPEMNIGDPLAAAHVISGSMVYWMLTQEILGGKHVTPIAQQRVVAVLKSLFLERIGKPQPKRRR